jgi:hypothetical protein
MDFNRRVVNHPFNRSVLLTLLLAAAAVPCWAQSNLGVAQGSNASEAVIGLTTLCPAFEFHMRKALAQVARQRREPGQLETSFVVDGRRIGDVAIVGTPFDYHRATRRAVRSLDCDNGSTGPQTIRLQVVFKDL